MAELCYCYPNYFYTVLDDGSVIWFRSDPVIQTVIQPVIQQCISPVDLSTLYDDDVFVEEQAAYEEYADGECTCPPESAWLTGDEDSTCHSESEDEGAECYLPSGAAAAAYMPAGTPGAGQNNAQATMRVHPTPQPQATPQQQQEMSKNSMSPHNFVPTQSQTQTRAQFSNYSYRGSQHGSRPNSHPRQQQPFIPGAAAAGTAPVMYSTLVFQPTPMSIPQSYQQPRSQGYYQYMTPFISYSNPNHTPSYYFPSGTQQLPAQNLATGQPGRSGAAAMGPQGAPAAPAAPAAALGHPAQPQPHMHPNIPGVRPATKKHSHRLAIIDPATNQDILSTEIFNDSQYASGESSERQTPQPEAPNRVAEEFTRMVSEAAKQSSDRPSKSNYPSKNLDTPETVATFPSTVTPPTNTITTPGNNSNNNIAKSDITINDTKSLGPDVAAEPSETPVVSAISDSPVIVPKLPMNIKQLQKNSEPNTQPLVIVESNKNAPAAKQQKNNKVKPVVPQSDEVEGRDVEESSCLSPPPATAPVPAPEPSAPVPAPEPAAPVPAPATPLETAPAALPAAAEAPAPPQPQGTPRERSRPDDPETDKEIEAPLQPSDAKPNGPTTPVQPTIPEVINTTTSQTSSLVIGSVSEPTSLEVPASDNSKTAAEQSVLETKSQPEKGESLALSATELLSASIEKVAKEELKESSSAIEAQAKLTQSIASCLKVSTPESGMKDLNKTEADTTNGTTTAVPNKEDENTNEKAAKNTKNMNKKAMNNSNDSTAKETESCENGKDETDKINNVETENALPTFKVPAEPLPKKTEAPAAAPAAPPAPKYKYSDDQWSPWNKTGKKCYDLGLLKQIRDDPLSKNKPEAPLLESCKVIRETVPFTPISRPINDSLFPSFAKGAGGISRSTSRDPKKDGRNISTSGKGSIKSSAPGGSGPKLIHVSLSLRDEVKLNEIENAWKPTRLKNDTVSEEDYKTEELYKKFRGILNKLTPQKFDTLMERVKQLEINNQSRLDGVINLVFEKAIEEPNFSETYAAMCTKLSKLVVPADNPTTPDQVVNFKGLIISKCQNQFETNKVNEEVQKIEKELAACTDPAKKKELQLQLQEEHRKIRIRSVGNVRFIGELYKEKILTARIMVICMKNLIEVLVEEKLECLCKLLTTIGEQIEGEVKGQLDLVFKKMQDIVDRKSNKISSRVRFMIQDVIELRRRKWVPKSVVVDSQPKMMDQIQKEAEQQQRNIELMNAGGGGGGGGGNFRREDGGRGKRGGDRRGQPSNNSFMESNWKTSRSNFFDSAKLKAVTNKPTSLSNIKLAPQMSGWNHGSGTKNTAQAASNSLMSLPTTINNKYSVLAESVQTDPASIRGNKESSLSYHSKGASIERSTFSPKGDFASGGSRSGSGSVGATRAQSPVPAVAPPPAAVSAPQEPLSEVLRRKVASSVGLYVMNPESACTEAVADVADLFPVQYHAALVAEILNLVLEKSAKQIDVVVKVVMHLISTNTISTVNFVSGLSEFMDCAPDSFIDIPMLYDYLAKFVAPLIEKKYITFDEILKIPGMANIRSANHGHLLLRGIMRELKESMGPTFVQNKWQSSASELKQWMDEDQVLKFIQDNKLEFLEVGAKATGEVTKILSPSETQQKLLSLMNSDESCECIQGWVQDNLGKTANEEWFMRALIQSICEHALFGLGGGGGAPRFKQERMNKYSGLIHDFGESKQAREASCLFGIQQLIHRLEHPQGLTLEIFQYLHEQYIISVEGFIAWEESEKEPEGKAVMLKALTSFFTNIREADNEDSCSED